MKADSTIFTCLPRKPQQIRQAFSQCSDPNRLSNLLAAGLLRLNFKKKFGFTCEKNPLC